MKYMEFQWPSSAIAELFNFKIKEMKNRQLKFFIFNEEVIKN